MKNTNLLQYNIADGVTAFSTMRNAELPYPVLQPHQVHSDEVVIVESRTLTRDDLQGVDALITALNDYPIAVRTADCVPVLLYDPVQKVVAAVHSGWRGTVKRISQKTIRIMCDRFSTTPSHLMAVIGPSIGPDSFEVGQEVVDAFRDADFPMADINIPKEGVLGKSYIDLWKSNAWLLEEMGVKAENIQVAGIDTFQRNDLFFSARHEGRKCGRIINVISLRSKVKNFRH